MSIYKDEDEFASEEFILNNKYYYDKFIGYRVHGYSSHTAFLRAFGQNYIPEGLSQMINRFEQMEATEYFQTEFNRRLKDIPVDKLWNDKTAMHELLSVARHPAHKDSTRLAAIKELNVIANITIETDSGRSKSVHQLSDFYRKEGKTAPTQDTSKQAEQQQTEGAADQQGQ